jgi:hypothetical protein
MYLPTPVIPTRDTNMLYVSLEDEAAKPTPKILRRKPCRLFRPNPLLSSTGKERSQIARPQTELKDAPKSGPLRTDMPLPPPPPTDKLSYLFNFEAPLTRLPPEEGEELSQAEIGDLIAPWPPLHLCFAGTVYLSSESGFLLRILTVTG